MVLWRLAICLLLPVILSLGGCNKALQESKLSAAEANIQKISTLYMEFKEAHQGAAPSTMQQLKSWANALSKDKVAQMGIDDLENTFVSPRDNEPYVLVKLEMGMGPIIAYEKTGEKGKHLVVSSVGSVFELSDAELKDRLENLPRYQTDQ